MLGIQIPADELIRLAEKLEGLPVVNEFGTRIGTVAKAEVKTVGIYPNFGLFVDIDTDSPKGTGRARIF